MAHVPYHPAQPWRPQTTGFRRGWVLLFTLLAVGGIGLALYLWLQTSFGTVTRERPLELARGVAAALQGIQHEPVTEVPKTVEPDRAEQLAQELQRYKVQQAQRERQLQAEIEALKHRPAPPAAQAAPKPIRRYAPSGTLTREVKGDATPKTPLYTLAPGATKIACQVETRMNSDIENIFTVKTTTAVWDTATGKHLLIPQGSTILGKYQSGQLLYGNQRLPTVSTTLTFPDGRSVPLDESPTMDLQGTAGLVTRVNNHWWRNFGAVIIQGVLRGGAQTMQAGASAQGATGQVGAGVANSTSQYGQQVIGRSIDTRPTIEVDPGELCTIILVKPLQLPAFFS